MVVAKVWRLVRRPDGEPTVEDFSCVEEELPPCGIGDVVVEAESFTVDPYMRIMSRDIPLNSTMIGEQVAKVIESKNPKWPVGTYLLHKEGWRTHSYLSSKKLEEADNNDIEVLPDMKDLPKSLGLGILGMPGKTAYLGVTEILQAKAGETLLVNGAAGAVGSAVIQIAKIKGCKVVAFAGSDEKVAYAKELGADHAFNYKTTNIGIALSKAAPEKINCYFDNVGGQFTAEALPYMAQYGRVMVCGSISTYNDEKKDPSVNSMNSAYDEYTIIFKELKIQGFIIFNWKHRGRESVQKLQQWVLEGKLKYRETVTQGFENMPNAFIGLFHGSNIGKAIVMV